MSLAQLVNYYEHHLGDLIAQRDAATSPSDKSRINGWIRSARLAKARQLGTHTEAQWLGLVAAFGARCVMCGVSTAEGGLRKDHIVPIYQGGSDGMENLQPLCIKCNCAKGPDSFNWAEYRMAYGFEE